MAKTKKKGKPGPAKEGTPKASNAQLPRLKTSAADLENNELGKASWSDSCSQVQLSQLKTSAVDLEKHKCDRSSESDTSSNDVFFDCRTCECNNNTNEHNNNKADVEALGKGKCPVGSPAAECAARARSGASPGPTLHDKQRPSLGNRSRGHSLSKSTPHTDLQPGKAAEIKASLEQIVTEGGPLQTLDEAKNFRAQEREKIKRIRSDSITLIRERTRSRQNSLNSTRVNSPTSAAYSPFESHPSTPSITVTNEYGLDMPRDWTDSQIAAERIRRGITRDEINREVGATPLAPPNPMNPLNMINPLSLTISVPRAFLHNPVNYNERVSNYARFHNGNLGREWGPSPPEAMGDGMTPTAYETSSRPLNAAAAPYEPLSNRIFTVAEEPTSVDPIALASPRLDFAVSPRSLSQTLENPKPPKPRAYRSKSCVGQIPGTQAFKRDGATPTPPDPDDPDDGDLTDPEDDNPPKREDPEPHAYTPWAQKCHWFYMTTDRAVNEACMLAGEIAMILPNYVEKPETRLRKFPGSTVDSRCDIDAAPSTTRIPTYVYDAPNDRFVVHASRSFSFDDVRNDTGHPDHVPSERLLKYQAFEFAGFEVFRHDRRLFNCGLEGCGIENLIDHELRTRICWGCGPKSSVRYCSKEHLVKDIENHWEWCGQTDVLLPFVVDEKTQPGRFYRYFPMIEEKRDRVNVERHRQVVHAVYSKGQYTMFPENEAEKFVLEWPEGMRGVMLPRVERLLNVALQDWDARKVIGYLYRLLRYCLRIQGKWDSNHACQLYWQVAMEFGYRAPVFEWYEDTPCECEWTGAHDFKDKSGRYHGECAFAVQGVGEMPRGKGIKETVERLEMERWILRLWRRRMGVKGWKKRLRGEGFDGVVKGNVEFIAENKWKSWGNKW